MARKGDDIVQIKLRVPERIRRQVLAEAKKSGRSLNNELNRLIGVGLTIEGGSITPEHQEAIKNTAIAAVSPFIQMFSAMIFRGLESTPGGREFLKSILASMPEQRRSEVQALLASDPQRALVELQSVFPFAELQSQKDQTP